MTRTCPACGHRGTAAAFPLLPPRDTPPRHDGRRRKCPACGHEGRAWTFSGRGAVAEERRRATALSRFECPDHGGALEEAQDWDEHGALVTYWCFADPDGPHVFGSIHDGVGGYAPVDDRIGVLAIDVDLPPLDQQKRRAGHPMLPGLAS